MATFFAKKDFRDGFFLLFVGVLFFVLRFPSLYEPYWYGDEGIYFIIGRALSEGRELYTTIWDNKPPLLYWLYALWNDNFSIRLVSMIFGLFSIGSFFYLSRLFFRNTYVVYLTTLLFTVLFALPNFEGNIANAENFMLLPVITGALFFWQAKRRPEIATTLRNHYLVFSGLCLGIAFLFKTVAVFDFAAFLFFAFFLESEHRTSALKQLRNYLKQILPYFLGFSIPILIVGIVFLLQGTLFVFLETILFRNAGYVGEKNVLIIPQGLLVLKTVLLLLALAVLFRIREKLSRETLFVVIWLIFALYSAFFSQRPYVHYQLVLLPAFALAVGLVLDYKSIRSKIILAIPLLALVHLLFSTFPQWHVNSSTLYYPNFLSYLRGQKSLTEYRSFFDRNTERDYLLADYLSLYTSPGDEIFIWGNSPQIYYLSNTLPTGKYAVAYHIFSEQTINETQTALKNNPPKFVIIMPNTEPFPFSLPDHSYTLTLGDSAIYERND